MVTPDNKSIPSEGDGPTGVLIDVILSKPVTRSTLFEALLTVCSHKSGIITNAEIKSDPYQTALSIRGSRILLVEDNSLNQLVAKKFLEKAGLSVIIANHGGEALQRVSQEHFDAVLMDLHMPVMDGYEATRRIRALPEGERLPIIAMTAAAMQQDIDACIAVGMNGHIAKPLVIQELIESLICYIEPKERAQNYLGKSARH